MSKQTINLGTAPTGVGGDTPRSAFTKTQSNMDEIYAALGASGSPMALPAALPIANGGTGGTTPALARSGLGLGSAALAPILGTVSQSGGVPTGAIVEVIQNANGTATKFADGTMICRRTLDLGSVSITTISGSLFASPVQTGKGFAAAFSVFPECHISLISSSASAYAGTVNLPGTTASQSFYVLAPSSGSQNITAVITAIGRWF